MVDVEQKQSGRRFLAPRPRQHRLDHRVKATAIEDAGQRIDERGFAMLHFELLLRRGDEQERQHQRDDKGLEKDERMHRRTDAGIEAQIRLAENQGGEETGEEERAVDAKNEGGGARHGLHAFRGAWDVPGIVMVAPAARGDTWSFFGGRDVDVSVVERAVAQAFARCSIDRRLVAVGGFSDGASYALTLGLTNGDLFRAVIALSPGGAHTDSRVGAPRVFVAHGTGDPVLPVEGSDAIVRSLRNDGYRVTYRRFSGVHEVRPEIARASVRWFVRG